MTKTENDFQEDAPLIQTIVAQKYFNIHVNLVRFG